MTLAAAARPGTSIAGYTIECVLGRGGMAVVYRATHPDRSEPVALKLIAAAGWDGEAQAEFESEARLAAAVAHRHILPVYDAGEHESFAYVAMRLEQSDLGALLREQGRLSPTRAVALIEQVASALDAAHAHGLVHRDIKPQNVLLGHLYDDECAYVADFGVARVAFSGGDAAAGEMVGTVGYASPEQIRGEPVDHRTDVYAVGCLLYECLTGRAPFIRGSSLTTLWAHLHDEPPEPSLLVPELPPGLDGVVRRALAKAPDARFGSAGALAEAARRAVDGRREPVPGVAAAPEPRPLPAGTVTFLFTDVEGSTRLLHRLGDESYAAALAEHRETIRAACDAHGGVEVDTQGDAFFFAFASADGALAAAELMTRELASSPIRVRVGLHTGTPHVTSEGYVGQDVHRAARIAATGHGGQVLVSDATEARLTEPSGSEPQALSLVSLGAHRLKDFDGPVTLFQSGDGSFPPLKTIANTNLPTPASTFLGRDRELLDADELLRGARLLTVTGPGGQGKTRFALELARRAREERFGDYEDGVFGCFLAPLRDPSLVLPTIAQSLSVREEAGRSALETLAAYVADRRMLILLDNLEHLLDATPDLSRLASSCPGLTLLLTSRERLRTQGEVTYDLPSLAEGEGVALFCERAGVEPSDTIAELCMRLEGLPLAIELAAARMRVLSPEQLAERLSSRLDLLRGGRDADPRQQTLRATIEWSFDLLAPAEQQLFARLAVFAGGCTLEAAEEVCHAELDALESLVDKSLLRYTDGRFWMLETIREYARERLQGSGGGDACDAHADYFLALAEQLEPPPVGAHDETAMPTLLAETDNLRAAIAFLADRQNPARELRLVGSLFRFWEVGGLVLEGRRALEHALRRADDTLAPSSRLKALYALGICAYHLGDLATARQVDEERLALARLSGDERGVALALSDLGLDLVDEVDAAVALLEESRQLAAQIGEREIGALAALNLAMVCLSTKDFVRARELSEEALSLTGDPDGPVGLMATGDLAGAMLGMGEVDGALVLLRETLSRSLEVLGPAHTASGLEDIAHAHLRNGDALRAARLLGAASPGRRSSALSATAAGSDPDLSWRIDRDGRSAVGEDAWNAAFAEGAAMSLDEAVAYALEVSDAESVAEGLSEGSRPG